MTLHLASKSCRSHSHLKAFRSAIASLKLKRKATASEQGHSRPSPSCHASQKRPDGLLSLLIPLTPYYEVIFNREAIQRRGYRGCTRGPPTPLRTCSPSHEPALKNKRPSIRPIRIMDRQQDSFVGIGSINSCVITPFRKLPTHIIHCIYRSLPILANWHKIV